MAISFATDCPIKPEIWHKLRTYIRSHSFGQPADIDDLTQDVFFHLLNKGALERLRDQAENEAHFLAMLCTTAKRHMIDLHRRRNSLKRNAGRNHLSLDSNHGSPLQIEAPESTNPRATLYARELETLVDECKSLVRQEYERIGKARVFEACHPSLDEPRSNNNGAQPLAERLGISKQAVHSHLKRMRCHYRDLVSTRLAEAA